MQRTRSIGHRPDTLTLITLVSDYKNHRVSDHMNLKGFYYISNILDSSWFSPVNIESMGEILLYQKMIIAFSI